MCTLCFIRRLKLSTDNCCIEYKKNVNSVLPQYSNEVYVKKSYISTGL